jgi:hypothetical protein
MKAGTYELIRLVQPHVLTLQEIRRPLAHTPAYNYVFRVRSSEGDKESQKTGDAEGNR